MAESPVNLDKKVSYRGFLYQRSRCGNGKLYWECIRLRRGTSTARLITADIEPERPVVKLKRGEDKESG